MAGRLAYLEKHPQDSAEALKRADKIKPLAEQDRLTLALALEFSRQGKEAREEILKLTRIAPQNAEYVYMLGRIDIQNQQIQAAAADFAQAIKLDPKLIRAYQEQAEAEEELGRPDEARRIYEKAAAVNRELPRPSEWPPMNLAAAVLKTNDFSGAEKLLRESLQYNPRFSWAHYYMGQLLHKQDRETDAMKEYKAAVVNDSRLRQAWLALGQGFAREGNKTEADRCIAIFKKLDEQQNALKNKH